MDSTIRCTFNFVGACLALKYGFHFDLELDGSMLFYLPKK